MTQPSPDDFQLILQDLQTADAKHHMHPFTDPAVFDIAPPFIIDAAKGSYVTGQGVQLFDAMAGLGCVNIGYGRQEMADTAAKAMQSLSYYHSFAGISTPSPAALARAIARVMPDGHNKVFFSNSGSEAVETALKLVRRYWKVMGKPSKKIIISRDYAYHGSSMATTALNGREEMRSSIGLDDAGVVHVDAPFWYRHGGDMTPDEFGIVAARKVEEAILEAGAENVAAFIAEPIQGTGGAIIPPDSYFAEINRIVAEHDVLLIADEVLTGLGRAGGWTASAGMGINADIITLAKGMTSGYMPLAATTIHDRLSDAIKAKNEVFHHGFTTGAHPVACQVALANMQILDKEKLISRVHSDIGPFFASRMAALEAHPLVGEVRARGLLCGIEIAKNKATREQYPIEAGIDERIGQAALLKGLIVRPTGNTIVLCPTFIITKPEVEFVLKTMQDALEQVYAEMKTQGLV